MFGRVVVLVFVAVVWWLSVAWWWVRVVCVVFVREKSRAERVSFGVGCEGVCGYGGVVVCWSVADDERGREDCREREIGIFFFRE